MVDILSSAGEQRKLMCDITTADHKSRYDALRIYASAVHQSRVSPQFLFDPDKRAAKWLDHIFSRMMKDREVEKSKEKGFRVFFQVFLNSFRFKYFKKVYCFNFFCVLNNLVLQCIGFIFWVILLIKIIKFYKIIKILQKHRQNVRLF